MKSKSYLSVVLGFALVLVSSLAADAQNSDVAVVVSSSNSVSNLTMGELRKILGGEKRTWANGTVIKLLVRGPATRERTVLLHLLGMNESSYKQYWVAQIYRGDASEEPITLPSNGMQREAINTFPGSIALVSANDVKPGMKVVKINGKISGDPQYPLN